jgi:hypothetical protein
MQLTTWSWRVQYPRSTAQTQDTMASIRRLATLGSNATSAAPAQKSIKAQKNKQSQSCIGPIKHKKLSKPGA